MSQIIYSLKDMGHRVRVLPLRGELSLPKAYLLGRSARFIKKVESIIKTFKPDRMIIDDRVLPLLWKLSKNETMKSIKSYAVLYKWENSRDLLGISGYITRDLKKRAAKMVDGFISSHPEIKDRVIKICGKNCNITVAPPGFDRIYRHTEEIFIKKKSHSPDFNILFVGNLLNHKGLDILITALSYVKNKGQKKWQLNVAGSIAMDPAYVLRIREEIESLSMGNNIQLLGMVDDYTLADLYEKSHIVVHMSNIMEMGIAAGEGLCYGTVPVASNRLGAKYWIGDAGIWLNPNDIRGLSKSIYELMIDREKYQQYAIKAYRTYTALPSWKDSVEKAIAVITG